MATLQVVESFVSRALRNVLKNKFTLYKCSVGFYYVQNVMTRNCFNIGYPQSYRLTTTTVISVISIKHFALSAPLYYSIIVKCCVNVGENKSVLIEVDIS